MKLKLIAPLAGLLTALSSSAWSQTIVQSDPINIAAVVTIGGAPASVTQTGKYNYAGVVQSGVNPTASIAQTGSRVNAGFIGQSGRNTATGNITQGGGPRVNNSAAVSQTMTSSGYRGWRR